MFKWDGSNIGEIEELITLFGKIDDYDAAFLYSNDEEYTVLITNYRNSLPLIIDEIKPLFKVKKLGRHLCTINGIKKIITNVSDDSKKLSNLEFEEMCQIINFNKEIKYIYHFRYMLGLMFNNEKSIIVSDNKIHSFNENCFNFKASNLSQACMKKWFNDDWFNLAKISKKLVPNLSLFKFRLDEIILRIDKRYIHYSAEIINRIDEVI